MPTRERLMNKGKVTLDRCSTTVEFDVLTSQGQHHYKTMPASMRLVKVETVQISPTQYNAALPKVCRVF